VYVSVKACLLIPFKVEFLWFPEHFWNIDAGRRFFRLSTLVARFHVVDSCCSTCNSRPLFHTALVIVDTALEQCNTGRLSTWSSLPCSKPSAVISHLDIRCYNCHRNENWQVKFTHGPGSCRVPGDIGWPSDNDYTHKQSTQRHYY